MDSGSLIIMFLLIITSSSANDGTIILVGAAIASLILYLVRDKPIGICDGSGIISDRENVPCWRRCFD